MDPNSQNERKRVVKGQFGNSESLNQMESIAQVHNSSHNYPKLMDEIIEISVAKQTIEQ